MNNLNTTTKKTQLDDIASALGLSKSTVSRAISGKGRVSPSTRERVRQCIIEMNYSPPSPAAAIGAATRNIGIVIPIDSKEEEAPFFRSCLMGVSKECAARDYDAVVISTEKNDLSHFNRIIEKHKVDGVIITRPLSDNRMEAMLKEKGVPFVVMGSSMQDNAVIVDNDHIEGCRELTLYLLISNRPDKVGIILGDMSHTVNASRFKGYNKAFEAAGKSPAKNMVYTDCDSGARFSRAVKSLMENEPSCIICGDDMICLKLLSELKLLGKSVPEDVRIASFYDSVYLDNSTPPVTSLVFDSVSLGEKAASVMIDMLSGNKVQKKTTLSFEMLIRKSTM